MSQSYTGIEKCVAIIIIWHDLKFNTVDELEHVCIYCIYKYNIRPKKKKGVVSASLGPKP